MAEVVQIGGGRSEGGPYPHLIPLSYIHDRNSSWMFSRRLGLYPELGWSFGILTERTWALSSRLPALFYECLTDFDRIRWAVWLGYEMNRRKQPGPHVSLGFEYFDRTYRTTTGRLELPKPGERFAGRHWVRVVGSRSADELLFQNSWGQHWGDDGFGYLSREYFKAHVKSTIVNWNSDTGPSPQMNRCLRSRGRSRAKAADWLQCWTSENHFWIDELLIDSVPYTAVSWSVVSLGDFQLVDVYELRNPRRVVGRLHLYAGDAETPPSIRELFVAPQVRRRGFAQLLEEAAVGRVRERGAEEVEIWIHGADLRPRCAPAARGFAVSRGYDLESIDKEGLEVGMIGRRSV